jgi:hypothetical protein
VELGTAQDLVISSTPSDWQHWDAPCWATSESHGDRATYRLDVALELAWGRVANDEFVEEWTSRFPDTRASSFYAEATYGGTLVLQELLVHVDGDRYMLPLPRIHKPDPGSNEIEWRVDRRRLAVARLLDGLAGSAGYDLDSSIRQAGFILE